MNKLYLLFLLYFSFNLLNEIRLADIYKSTGAISLEDTTPFSKTINRGLRFAAPFQGVRTFCPFDHGSKVVITIHGNNALIISDKKRVKGVFKKDKFFSNDPDEIAYRRVAGEYNYGKYYVIDTSYFSILNVENGEYSYYKLCEK